MLDKGSASPYDTRFLREAAKYGGERLTAPDKIIDLEYFFCFYQKVLEAWMSTVRLFPALLLFALLFAPLAEAAPAGTGSIRVAIIKGAEKIRVEGYGLAVTDGRGVRLAVSFPAVIRRDRGGLSVGRHLTHRLTLSSPGVIRINGKGYRGIIEVASSSRGLLVIDELPVEDYLIGLINCEISSQWPMEAVKAQVVVSRTFALYQKETRNNSLYHLESSVIDQVYDGSDIEDSRAAQAVEETRGEVLTFAGAIIQSFFHSSCGGHTEDSEYVWSVSYPYLRGVVCANCSATPSVLWEQTIGRRKLESLLKRRGYAVSGLRVIRPVSRNRSGRIVSLELVSDFGALTIPAVKFRAIVGYGVIRSTDFEVTSVDDNFVFIGVGYGHGVGMCQWGAKQRAEEGLSYRDILSYYYPGTRLERYHTD